MRYVFTPVALILAVICGMLAAWSLKGAVAQPALGTDQPELQTQWVLPQVHCAQFLYGMPLPAATADGSASRVPLSNDLVIRGIYALSNNAQTKLADWVAYRLTPGEIAGDARSEREWRADPWLEDAETLEPADYEGASKALQVDRGHQAPLASFKGTTEWEETNYLSNITPQRDDLNQGAWLQLENAERELVAQTGEVFVYTGPLYEKPMPPLPQADEPHTVPSGYWKVVLVREPDADLPVQAAAFIFEQDTPRPRDEQQVNKADYFLKYSVNIDEVEQRSGLDLLSELPDDVESYVESEVNSNWLWHVE
jgi:endonuclease G, mitochondrial